MIFKYFYSVNRYLNILLLISILSVILTDLFFYDLPELFSGASRLLDAYYNFCIGIVVSYLFYFIVVHVKEQDDKENLNVHILEKSKHIVRDYKVMLIKFKHEANFESNEEYLSLEDIFMIFSKIDPCNNAPLIIGHTNIGTRIYANWLQFILSHKTNSQNLINKIFIKMAFLDTEHVRILTEIEDCFLFISIDNTGNIPHSNVDMLPWAEQFYDYSVLCKKLEKYNNTI